MTKTQHAVILAMGLVLVLGTLVLVSMPGKTETPTAAELSNSDSSQTGQPTYTNSTPNDIVVTLPFPGAVTGKTFSVIGKARGYWFFEASFPVRVLDKDGTQIGVGLASPTGGEWMTEEFVEFEAKLAVPDTYQGPATLILERDNPSGDPERDASISLPFTVEY